GRDQRIPKQAFVGGVASVRVTDDGGATAVERASQTSSVSVSRVAPVGVPVTLSVPDYDKNVTWDANGDGAFDDGTGNQISFTYPGAGTYEVHVRGTSFNRAYESVETVSVRDGADIAVPTATWYTVPAARATVPVYVGYAVSGPGKADASLDLDGD